MRILLCYLIASCSLSAQAGSPLYLRGYMLIPEPQSLQLKNADFTIDATWSIVPGVNAKELGSASKVLAEFIQKAAGYLHSQGRKVIFWGEPPLKAEDVPMLPAGLINGEVYGTVYNEEFRKRGIRQMIYTNSLPNDPFFPGVLRARAESSGAPAHRGRAGCTGV